MLSAILDFIEGPLLKWVFSLLIIGLGVRTLFFMGRMLTSPFHHRRTVALPSTLFNLIRSTFPLHSVSMKRPVYTALRYLFHFGLLVVPIWFSGHVYMWQESSWELYYDPLPDEWMDILTLVVIGLGIIFALRRVVLPHVRRGTAPSDFLIIALAIAPFITGYWYTHGTLDHIAFFSQYLWYFHVFSGEVMLLMMVFLFCRTRLRRDACVGCAACEVNCPTSTLDWEDDKGQRTFKYAHYQCICCGTCIKVCPERAAELRHEIGIGHFFKVFGRATIQTTELNQSQSCGIHFAPGPQIAKLDHLIAQRDLAVERVGYCNRCKKRISSKGMHMAGANLP